IWYRAAVWRNSPTASSAGSASSTPPLGMSHAGSNWIGADADASPPIAAATRSADRVGAKPKTAGLPLRWLLLVASLSLAPPKFFFLAGAGVRRGWLYALCSATLPASWPLPALPAPHPTGLALALSPRP